MGIKHPSQGCNAMALVGFDVSDHRALILINRAPFSQKIKFNTSILTKLMSKCSVQHRGGGGHSNTSIEHMRDQRFSKHILKEICPYEENHP